MEKLNLPEYQFKTTTEKGKSKIFDVFRKKYVALTPEEYVRQNFLKYLCDEKNYPASLISVEGGLKYNRLQKRSDAVVYSREAKPIMLIEFKAPSVSIGDETIKQVLSYNYTINASHIIVTNGLNHFCLKKDNVNKRFIFLDEIPEYDILTAETNNL